MAGKINRDHAKLTLHIRGNWATCPENGKCRLVKREPMIGKYFGCYDNYGNGEDPVITRDIEVALDFLETGNPIPDRYREPEILTKLLYIC